VGISEHNLLLFQARSIAETTEIAREVASTKHIHGALQKFPHRIPNIQYGGKWSFSNAERVGVAYFHRSGAEREREREREREIYCK